MPPSDADRDFQIALAHDQAGQLAQAEALCRQILAEFPDHDGALGLLGVVALKGNRLDVAIENLRRATQVNPGAPVYHVNLGSALMGKGKRAEAIACFRRTLALAPDLAEAHNNLGNALNCDETLDEAIACYRRALELKAGYFEAHNNLGAALRDRGKLDEAAASYRRALELKPDYIEAHANYGHVLKSQKKLDDAAFFYKRALELAPRHPESHKNFAHLLLLQGAFDRGWEELEWRWQCATFTSPKRSFAQPQWTGGPLDGRSILLHAEQGLGDTLHFIRYVPLVAERGGQVIVECQAPLNRLLQNSLGPIPLIDYGKPLPPFDVHCPLMSLPRAFQTRLETIPAKVPYLHAAAESVARWRNKLEGTTHRLKVGLAWAGHKIHKDDRNRSLALQTLAPLGRVPGVCFYSLQKGPPAMEALRPPAGLSLFDWTNELDDFADTAAFIANLDLVIAVDTAVAHLAGAMGKPVWTLLPFVPDWRWLLDRADSPWYPTMRLFRQSTAGDWPNVVQRVADSLEPFASGQVASDGTSPLGGEGSGVRGPNPPKTQDFGNDSLSPHPDPLPPEHRGEKGKEVPPLAVAPEPAATNPLGKALLENGPVRLKQGRHGPILYLATDKYVGGSLDRYGEFSEGESALFRQFVRPGWTVLEIGANMGAHTPSLAKMVGAIGAIHAFEPQRVLFQILCANVAINALTNVYTYHAAVGREAGTIIVPKLDYTVERNYGGLSLGGVPNGEPVPLLTVDSLNLPACHLMKVDVEGMEEDVIAGAEQTIRRYRPVLYVENDRQEKSAGLIRRIWALDYRLYWHLPLLFNPSNFFGETENIFAKIVSVNMLGMHASVAQNVTGLREVTDPDESWNRTPK